MKDRLPLLLLLLLVGLWQPSAWTQTIDREALQRQAEQGNVKAQTKLGYLYHTGEDVERNYAEAVKWYRLAAEQEDPDAQYNLGVAYAFGEGVELDLARASTWYRRAAEQGHRVAAFSLGLSYLHGDGVQRDTAQAAGWFRQAAKQGYTRAQVHLASLYHTGEGIPRDYEAAAYWYRQAAERGAAIAQYNLGNLYHTGHGVPQDDDEALHWFRKAAQQEYALAKTQLEAFGQRAPAGTDTADAAIPPSPGGTPSPGAPSTGSGNRIVSPPLEAAESVDVDAAGRAEAPTEQSPTPDTATVANEPSSSGFADMTAADRQQPDATEAGAAADTAPDPAAATGDTETTDDAEAGNTTGTPPADSQTEQTAAEQTAAETARTTVPDNSEWQEPVAEEDAAADQATADSAQKESIAALEDSPPVQADISISEAASAALTAENYGEALRLLQAQALNGNAAAENRLGDMYFQGEGVEQNRDRAFLWYRRAAKRNYAEAQFNLGNMYLLGEGVLQDDDKAREWYAKAAAQGHQAAAGNLANIKRRQTQQQRYNPDNHRGPTQQEMEAAVETATPAASDTAADTPPPERRLTSPPLEAQTEADAEPADVNNEVSPETLLENAEQSSQRIVTPPLEDTSN